MTKLYPYQKEGVIAIDDFDGRALLADEMGLGKSIQALTWVKRFRKRRRSLPAIIVCPAALKWNWRREALQHIGMESIVLESRSPPPLSRTGRTFAGAELIIINYDILGAWLPLLRSLRPKTVVFDECQFLKNRKAKRSKYSRQLCRRAKYLLALSGTPLTNRPSELWNILNMLRPDLYPAFFPYAMKHCAPRKTPWGWEYKGASKLPVLHRNLRGSMMIRRRKADVLQDLPEKSRHVFPIRLDRASMEEYQEAEADFIQWLRRKHPTKVNRAQRAERIVRMGYLVRLAATLKLPGVLEWISSFYEESDGKLVVFGLHKKVMKPIWKEYHERAVLVNGSVTGRRRQQCVDVFQNQHHCRMFLGQLKSAGVGLNLTAASVMAIIELGWDPAELNQGEDRIHRIGQKDGASCFYLIASDTIEARTSRILQEKQAILDQVLDGEGEDTSSLDIFTQLHKELLNG